MSLGDLLDAERDVPEPKHSPQETELVRVFGSLSRSRKNLLLRLARELAM